MEGKTVFVIGAGASSEVGLPTGDKLKGEISQLLNISFNEFRQGFSKSGDDLIKRALLKINDQIGSFGSIYSYAHEAQYICKNLPSSISIDNLIDINRGNKELEVCAKLAIVKAILDAEKSSLLFIDKYSTNEIDYEPLKETWYPPFLNLITELCHKNNLESRLSSITLIVFNYDRCLEHYLFNEVKKRYRISDKESSELVNKINIYHPYGSVGMLPWSSSKGSIEFGGKPSVEQLLELSEEIKTFTEGTDPNSSEIKAIKDNIYNADKLVFLGFSFNKLNMKLLAPENKPAPKTPKCFSSTYGISESNTDEIKESIRLFYGKPSVEEIQIKMLNKECRHFFNHFWKSLEF